MRAFGGVLLVAACLLASAIAYPGVSRDASDSDKADESGRPDTVLVLSGRPSRNIFGEDFSDRTADDDSSYFFPMSISSMEESWQDFMAGIRQRMRDLMMNMSGMINFSVPEGANTTSTVKIIDGHVVTINETVYDNDSGWDHSFVRVRVVDVKPLDNATTVPDNAAGVDTTTPFATPDGQESTTLGERSIETVEDLNNEIPKNDDLQA